MEELLACCAAPRWARMVADGSPYRDQEALLAAVDAAFADLSWVEVEQALSTHPRIGDRLDGTSREAAWSRREQAGVSRSDLTVAERLAAANRAYEGRFGHVFLVCADGMTADQIIAAAHRRLGNDVDTERAVVRTELAAITRLRLSRLGAS
ncbi:2-oxo-4-hydroxy-4-carboxy-5-ureidoimidazoline decarboxylase [Micromonospora echinofusca]|nr:2-oxo-4-hydroxy-4-carboxy-5-ureidoimidazoline decarboxylase [Micromonospora echinofusca]